MRRGAEGEDFRALAIFEGDRAIEMVDRIGDVIGFPRGLALFGRRIQAFEKPPEVIVAKTHWLRWWDCWDAGVGKASDGLKDVATD